MKTFAIAAAVIMTVSVSSALSQPYPTRTVRIIVPAAAGGGTDIVARLIAQKLTDGLGRTVIVDNRVGGDGTVGTEAMAKAAADGYTIGMDRPALQSLLSDVASGLLDVIVVYKVDRLTRSLSDFAKIVDILNRYKVSFVSVTQHFNTTSSMGRLTLNVLLSFAQSFLSFRSDEAQPTSTYELPSNSGLTSVGLSHSNRPGCRGVSR